MSYDKSIDINTFGEMVDGIDDIAQSWHIILQTIPGSDPLRPTFGSGIFNYIDKPINQFQGDFAVQIITDLERWEKRATITKVTRTIDNGTVNAKIYGIYTQTNTPIQVTLDLTSLKSEIQTDIQRAYSDAYNKAYS